MSAGAPTGHDGRRLLTLMRHGKAAAADEAGTGRRDARLDDHARPLVERGRRDVLAMAARTAVRADLPDVLLCSDARRTVETAELVRESFGLDAGALVHDARLYLASLGTLLAVIAEHDARGVRHLMIVGHNPGLEELAFRLDARGGVRERTRGLSTAALCRYARDAGAPTAEAGTTRRLFEDRP